MQGHICLPQGKDTTQNTREVPITKDTHKGVLNMERSLKPIFKNRRKGRFVDHRGREVCGGQESNPSVKWARQRKDGN